MRINPEADDVSKADLDAAAEYYDDLVKEEKRWKRRVMWSRVCDVALICVILACFFVAAWMSLQ